MFVEWMQCLPAGWVTDVARRGGQFKLSRSQMLKILGNGVVPPQALYAYSRLLAGDRPGAQGE